MEQIQLILFKELPTHTKGKIMNYFLYKINRISNIGGVHPFLKDDSTIELSIHEFDGWNLGTTENINELYIYDEFNPIIISEDIGIGFTYLDKSGIITGQDGFVIDIVRPFNSTELSQRNKALRFMKKLKIRKEIESVVGSDADLITDLSNRVDLLESLLFRFLTLKIGDSEIPPGMITDYNTIKNYLSELNVGTEKNRLSKESFSTILNKQKKRQTRIIKVLEDNDYI